VGTEAPRGIPQQRARPRVLAELGHRDAAQRQCWRVLAQRDPLQSAERVACSEGARSSADQ